jgi:hypothetical protein
MRHGEYKIIRFLAQHGLGDLASQESGNRDCPGLMRFRRAKDDAAADVAERSPDVDPAASQVDVADAQSGRLPPPQARVTEQQDKDPPSPRRGRQLAELLVSQEDVVASLDPGQAQTASCARRGPASAPGSALGTPARRMPGRTH